MTTQRALPRSVLAAFFVILPMVAWGQTTAIHAGRLIDPETGTEQQDQIILVEEGSIVAVGPNVLQTGYGGDGYDKRYLLGPLYMLLGDVDGALASFDWYENAYPDDSGDP